jgi:hypothetical protein
VKIQTLLTSGFVATTAILVSGYGAFEYWVNFQANTLSKSFIQGKLTQISDRDIEQLNHITELLSRSPLPWHQQEARRFTDLTEVAEAAQHTFGGSRLGSGPNSSLTASPASAQAANAPVANAPVAKQAANQVTHKVSQLQMGRLLTLQQELEDYVQRYPNRPYAAELKQELPAVRALATFFPVIKASAGERSVDSALRASRRGATLAALVIRKTPDAISDVVIAAAPAPAPTISWSKAENDVLYDYTQVLQPAEQARISDGDRLEIGHQVCSWLNAGQNYWGVRSMFDAQYKGTLSGDYVHNRDAYIRFSTQRLCPTQIASLTRPVEAPVAKAPAVAQVVEATTKTWNVKVAPQYDQQYGQQYGQQFGQQFGQPYLQPVQPYGGYIPYPAAPGFPGGIR